MDLNSLAISSFGDSHTEDVESNSLAISSFGDSHTEDVDLNSLAISSFGDSHTEDAESDSLAISSFGDSHTEEAESNSLAISSLGTRTQRTRNRTLWPSPALGTHAENVDLNSLAISSFGDTFDECTYSKPVVSLSIHGHDGECTPLLKDDAVARCIELFKYAMFVLFFGRVGAVDAVDAVDAVLRLIHITIVSFILGMHLFFSAFSARRRPDDRLIGVRTKRVDHAARYRKCAIRVHSNQSHSLVVTSNHEQHGVRRKGGYHRYFGIQRDQCPGAQIWMFDLIQGEHGVGGVRHNQRHGYGDCAQKESLTRTLKGFRRFLSPE